MLTDGIIAQLSDQEVWEEFLAWRLKKGRFNWNDFDEADLYVEREQYLPLARHLAGGGQLGIPQKITVNKMGSGKKRVVYCFAPDEMTVLKLIAHLLYKYDDQFAPNCYAFRRGLRASDALLRLHRLTRDKAWWAYKLDIHNYFNSIPVPLLLPMLRELLRDDPGLYHFFEAFLQDDRAVSSGQIVREPRGVMAGTPTAPFLADVYLNRVDHYFADAGVLYARYSDDIILFAPDRDTLEQHKATLLRFLEESGLEVNPAKERLYAPGDAFEFLGFKCRGREIDISDASVRKLKDKIRRKARALQRWKKRKGMDPERAMRALIRFCNRKFFEDAQDGTLTWSRWFFPIITGAEGLRQIDHYLQDCLRALGTGRHNKANYRITYDDLKRLGYRSLVSEYYKGRA